MYNVIHSVFGSFYTETSPNNISALSIGWSVENLLEKSS
jgi:hypothetical protein